MLLSDLTNINQPVVVKESKTPCSLLGCAGGLSIIYYSNNITEVVSRPLALPVPRLLSLGLYFAQGNFSF